ncbi:MAG TPA: octaprenyl diphosphate synthase, partial [Halomonas sp.]|nr:octaprenyl diphosphate synthase [Halomonas sp.]
MTANVSPTPPASPSPSPLHAVVADDFEAVNRTIVTQLNSRVPLVETIGQYIIESGG